MTCIVEFSVEACEVNNALAAACWYAEAALRGTTAGADAFYNFDADGVPISPHDIVCVEVLDAFTP